MEAKKPRKPTLLSKLRTENTQLKNQLTKLTYESAAREKRLRDDMVALAQKANHEDLEHLRARTELIKSMSWAMKACSSVMWSEKMTGWDFNRVRRP